MTDRLQPEILKSELSVSKGSVNNITVSLGYANECAHRVSCSLTDYHRTVQKEACSDLFFR